MSAIEDKIRKLLAVVSCDSASEAERETALQMASSLAKKYAVDLDQLGTDAAGYENQELARFSAFPNWLAPVADVLQCHFNVRTLFWGNVGFSVFGCSASRQVAAYVFTFLRREFLRRRREFLRRRREYEAAKNYGRPLSYARAGEFYRGLAIGLIYKLDERKKAEAEPTNAAALIRVESKLEDAYCAAFPGIPSRKSRADSVNADGVRAGYQISINPAVRGPELKRIGM